MKKTIYLLLLASLAIAGCVVTREVSIPLTDTWRFEKVPDSVLLSLPELPMEIGKVDYVRLPGGEIAIDSAGNIPFLFDYVDSYRMVQFDPIPTQRPSCTCFPTFVAQVGNKLLVTMLVEYKDIHYEGEVNAFYDMNGKFLKFLGEYAELFDLDYESRKKAIATDVHYGGDAILSINRFAKEICMTVDYHKSVYFDYDGNYLRTETHELALNTFSVAPQHLSDNYKYIFNYEQTSGYNPRRIAFVIDAKNKLAKKVSMFTDIAEFACGQRGGKDVMAQRLKSDTIWQITPDKMIARYVYQRENPEKHYDNPFGIRLWLSQPYAYLTDHYLISVMQYSTNNRDSVLIHGNATQIYDRQTGRSIFFKTLSGSSRYTTLQARTVDWHGHIRCELDNGELVLDYVHPSSRYPEPAAALKKILSNSLDKKTNKNNQYIVNKREEKFIRSLKLDGGPVLFFVKLKKF